jgi:hypothetical protein
MRTADKVGSLEDEKSRLKAKLKRVDDERDILQKGRHILCQGIRVNRPGFTGDSIS